MCRDRCHASKARRSISCRPAICRRRPVNRQSSPQVAPVCGCRENLLQREKSACNSPDRFLVFWNRLGYARLSDRRCRCICRTIAIRQGRLLPAVIDAVRSAICTRSRGSVASGPVRISSFRCPKTHGEQEPLPVSDEHRAVFPPAAPSGAGWPVPLHF